MLKRNNKNFITKVNKLLNESDDDFEFVDEDGMSLDDDFEFFDDDEIGALDKEWNWLVGEYDLDKQNIKNVHWTIGGPYFHDYAETDFATEWRRHHTRINFCKQKN